MSKKTLFYYLFLVEEGIAYYLTFRWSVILIACFISIFPTFMTWWALRVVLNLEIAWQLVFFIFWLILMIILLIEFPIPNHIKTQIRQKLKKFK